MIKICKDDQELILRPRWMYRWQGFFLEIIIDLDDNESTMEIKYKFFGLILKTRDVHTQFINVERFRNHLIHQVLRIERVEFDWLDNDIENVVVRGVPIKSADVLSKVVAR